MDTSPQRVWRHLTTGVWTRKRLFPPEALAAIEAAVRDCEAQQVGEIRVAIEPALTLDAVLGGLHPRERALQVFSELRVWDTEHNDGVLIYLLLADHDVEIVADRGAARGATAEDWERCCRLIEAEARAGRHAAGLVAGIRAVAEVLARNPALHRDAGNEHPDRPVLL